MRQQNSETRSPAIKFALWLTIILMLAILGVGAYFITTAYFFKDQPNKGHVRFSPGIYIEFNADSVKIDQNSYNNWKLLYYKNGDLTSNPIELNNSGELGYPTKVYNILSPEFKSAADANGESSPFVARAKIEYKDEIGKIKKVRKQPRGISRNKICILIATDTKKSFALIVNHGRPQRIKNYEICKKHIMPGSLLIGDEDTSLTDTVNQMMLISIK